MTWILCLVCMVLSLSATALSENILTNPGFEELDLKGMPVGWYTDAYNHEDGYTLFSVTTEDATGGERAACIRNFGENDARFVQKIRVEPESIYRVTGYIRTENVEGGKGANFSVEGLYTFSTSIYDTTEGWQYITWYGETGPDQSEVTLFVRLGGYSGESRGKAWFDDLSVEKVKEVPGNGIAARWYDARNISYYDEDENVKDTNSQPAWTMLTMAAIIYSLAAILLLQWLRRKSDKPFRSEKIRPGFMIGLLLAFLVRSFVSFHVVGYMVDVNCFTSWGATMAQYGPLEFYPKTNFCDYPPAYTYILGISSLICRLFPEAGAGFERFIFRLFPSFCDILTCILLDRFVRKWNPRIPTLTRTVSLLLLSFHPVTILNSAAWGQMDSVLALLLLMVALWASERKWHLALPSYTLAVLVKPQALMLGFLGLASLVLVWIKSREERRSILQGVAGSVAVIAVIVIPFSLHQDPFWIIGQYAETLSSYPYATVNTANYYYLFSGNWSSIENTAPVLCASGLALLSALYTGLTFLRGRKTAGKITFETALSCAFVLWFVLCAFQHFSWLYIGTAAMAYAFLIVLSCYLRKGDPAFLPYLGGLLFMLLYVFGIKMHERYIFPAILFWAAAYGIHRDRRILLPLLSVTCTTFINEGIVLDNSIRLGSSMGHLNQDTFILATILAAINVAAAVFAVYLGVDLSFGREKYRTEKTLVLDSTKSNRLQWHRLDTVAVCLILAAYSAVSFSTLGSRKAPQSAWTASDYSESVILDLGEQKDNFTVLYFARVSRYDFSISVSPDRESWEDETWAQMDQGQCWKWKYITDSVQDASGKRTYSAGRHWFTGRYVRITAHQVNLALCEIILRNELGEQLPIVSVTRQNGDPDSPLYSDPARICDEQDSLEGLPLPFFAETSDQEGEANPRIAQPSWWNSTYFDEIYHARTAWEFLTHSAPYETSHPPLGKVLMSWGIALFGMTPFGWRFAGAAAGVLMLLAIYLIVKQMTKETLLASFACSLFALDCMHLTQTQIATIDSFPVLFILFAFYFMLRFIQTDWRKERKARVLTDLGLCGLNMGLSIASKWIGIYAGAGLAVLFFWHGFRILKMEREENKRIGSDNSSIPSSNTGIKEVSVRRFLGICAWCVLFFAVIPASVYLLSYIPYFAYRHFTSFHEYLEAVISSQVGMFNYHATPGLGMDHPFYSPWYEWPVIGKPMYYANKQYVFDSRISYSIFSFGNPVIWWFGIPAMCCAVWLWLRSREESLPDYPYSLLHLATAGTHLFFLLIGFLAQYLPWALVPRGTYIYHYFASVPFLIICITLLMEQIQLRRRKAASFCMLGFILAAAGFFGLLFPYASGIFAPTGWLEAGRKILNIWY